MNCDTPIRWDTIVQLSTKKEQTTDAWPAWRNLMRYGKWKKSDSEGYILYGSVYMAF